MSIFWWKIWYHLKKLWLQLEILWQEPILQIKVQYYNKWALQIYKIMFFTAFLFILRSFKLKTEGQAMYWKTHPKLTKFKSKLTLGLWLIRLCTTLSRSSTFRLGWIDYASSLVRSRQRRLRDENPKPVVLVLSDIINFDFCFNWWFFSAQFQRYLP